MLAASESSDSTSSGSFIVLGPLRSKLVVFALAGIVALRGWKPSDAVAMVVEELLEAPAAGFAENEAAPGLAPAHCFFRRSCGGGRSTSPERPPPPKTKHRTCIRYHRAGGGADTSGRLYGAS